MNTEGFLKRLYEDVHAQKRGSAIMAMTEGKKITINEEEIYFDYSEKGINPKDFGYEFGHETKATVVFFPQS
ncbi:MAG: hypothetical protein KAI71_03245 [Candidatus Pacebacteria bacterium]|nr:hypothetical protein [Candidatus Paceibacterota bacterium]